LRRSQKAQRRPQKHKKDWEEELIEKKLVPFTDSPCAFCGLLCAFCDLPFCG
jgi:hypothetical protein